MLNRAANALYWMCRYLERAESTARLIEVNLHLSLDLPGEEDTWKAVVETTGDREHFHRTTTKSPKGRPCWAFWPLIRAIPTRCWNA